MDLRAYQLEDIKRAVEADSLGIFNEQRTGKTPTALMSVAKKGCKRVLIVCPASLLYVWKLEAERWIDAKTHVITSAAHFVKNHVIYDSDRVNVIIINYENLRDTGRRVGAVHTLMTMKFDGLIVDEAHRCKDKSSYNFDAVNKLTKIPYRLYLTGTPAPNYSYEVWSLLHFIEPKVFRSYWSFIDEYFYTMTKYTPNGTINEPTVIKKEKEQQFFDNLQAMSIMRKRKDVMPWLPKEVPVTQVKLPLTPSQRKYLKELEETFETEHVITQGVLDRLIRVRQICAHPGILGLKGSSPKLDWLKDYIKDYPEQSIIVFSNSTKFLKLVSMEVACNLIVGETPALIRKRYIDNFQSGKTKVLLIQTQAGKEGLTLDHADTTIFLDTYPPAADYSQAKDRMVATTPERIKPQSLIHLMMADSYDEQLYRLVEQNVVESAVVNDYINYIKRRTYGNNH